MADVVITVSEDKSAIISRSFIAVQGEDVTVEVNIPTSVANMGYTGGYLDFLLADGTTYWKGPYTSTSDKFTFQIDETHVTKKDGTIWWQFVLCDLVGTVRNIMWASIQYRSQILSAVTA